MATELDVAIIQLISTILITGALTWITYLYMRDTKVIREATHKPSFSFDLPITEPQYINKNGVSKQKYVYCPFMVNSGELAIDVRVKINVLGISEDEFYSEFPFGGKYYYSSIPKGKRVYMNMTLINIIERIEELHLNIKCKDKLGNEFEQKLNYSLKQLLEEGFEVLHRVISPQEKEIMEGLVSYPEPVK